MTMLAGCVLPDGALIAADCRGTWLFGGQELPADNVQKIIRIGPSNALAFTGDIRTVQYLLPHIVHKLQRRRTDAISVSLWLPRFLRRSYRALKLRGVRVGDVGFMVAGSIRGRPTRISRALFGSLVVSARALKIRNWLFYRCVREAVLRDDDPITVPDSSQGLLYGMHSPDFAPEFCPSLGVMGMGSGMLVADYLEKYIPLLACRRPDLVADALVDAIGGYLLESKVSTVGGMLVVAHAVDGGLIARNLRQTDDHGHSVEIFNRDFQFVVRDTRTGQEIPLLYPSQVLQTSPTRLVFDGLKRALSPERERMTGLRDELSDLISRPE